MDQDDLPGAEQPLADGERADLVVGHHSAGVPDHVRLAFVQAKDRVHVEPGIHARDHGGALGRGERKRAAELLRIRGVVPEVVVSGAHQASRTDLYFVNPFPSLL
jgi:hypothetical protein